MRRAQGASPRSPQRTRRLHGQRGLAWVALGALALALCALPLRAAGSLQQGRLGGGSGRRGGGAASADHPLFSRIDLNLRPFELSGISLQMVEQSYCQGSRGSSMRIQASTGWVTLQATGLPRRSPSPPAPLQVIRGSVYVVGESPSFQSRLLGLKRQLLALWLVGQLPEGLDVVLEQEDAPTVRPRSADCPQRGPLLAPAKQPGNASHAHVLLAPDHSFAGGTGVGRGEGALGLRRGACAAEDTQRKGTSLAPLPPPARLARGAHAQLGGDAATAAARG